MTSDSQILLIELLRQQSQSTWLAAIFALIGAGIGSYVSSYLRKRGEDKAAQENFDVIRAQLSTTTRDTEDIKQQLSGRTWRSQQQWAAREKYYSDLLTQLHYFRSALESLFDYYLEPGSEHIPDARQGDSFRALLSDARDAYAETQRLVGPAAIFLSVEAASKLEELFKAHWDLTTFTASCTYEYIEGASKLAEEAYSRVLTEAKAHLGISDV